MVFHKVTMKRRRFLSMAFGVLALTSLPLGGSGGIRPASAAPGAAKPAGARYFIKLRGIEMAGTITGKLPASAAGPGTGVAGAGGDAAGSVPATAAVPSPAGGDGAAPAPASGAGVSNATPVPNEPAEIALARTTLLKALSTRPEVVMDLELPADPAQISAELKRRGLRGYEVTLRILRMDRQVKPPPPGKQFRLLEQIVKVSLIGTTFPGELLALGGEGESTVQIEIGSQINDVQEREVATDALQDAVNQAVANAIRKLQIGPMVPPKDAPRRRPPAKK